jgi:flagellar hook assembly protein FlgD
LDHVIVENAGQLGEPAVYVIEVPQSFPITNSTIQSNLNAGLTIKGPFSGSVSGNTFTNNGSHGLVIEYSTTGSPSPALSNNTYTNNTPNSIRLKPASGGSPGTAIYFPTTLTKQETFYEILENINVITGFVLGTMTVEPGVTIKFGPGAGLKFFTNATLQALGTSVEHVTFTSNAVTPTPGSWKGLEFISTLGVNDRTIICKYCDIQYAGQGTVPAFSISETGPGGQNQLDHTTIQNNSGDGLYINNASIVVTNSTFSNNDDGLFLENNSSGFVSNSTIKLNNNDGIRFNGGSIYPNIKVNNNTIENNTNFELSANGGNNTFTVDAQKNWWGTTDPGAIAASIFDNADNPLRPVVDAADPLDDDIGNNPISNVVVTAGVFDPNGAETTAVTYDLASDANMTIKISDFNTQNVVRTLINGVSQTAGPQSIVWDGKNDTATILSDGIYVFRIEARNIQGDLLGIYDPSYFPATVTAQNITLTPADFDPYKGQFAILSYNLPNPALVSAEIGFNNTSSTPQLTLFTNKIKTASTQNDYWDGRANNGNFVTTPGPYIAAIFPKAIPENGIVIQTDSALMVDYVKADPYVFHPVYSDVTEIEFSLSIAANVTVKIENLSGSVLKTLLNNDPRSSGLNSVVWDGTNTAGELVSGLDKVNIRVEATDTATGVVVERLGTVTLF